MSFKLLRKFRKMLTSIQIGKIRFLNLETPKNYHKEALRALKDYGETKKVVLE
jgi:hypothetical protein